jgi:hypothetical protein
MLELKELHLAREALVKDRTAAKNRRNALTAPLLKRQNAQRLEQIERQMAAIEAEILKQILTDADLSRRFAILASIPGVSAVTALPCSSKCRNSASSMPDRPRVAQPSPDRPAVRPMDRTRLHPRRTSPSSSGRLHACTRRHPIQPGHEDNLRSPQSGRKAGKARSHSRHAKSARPRKRPLEGQSNLDPQNRLIKTDTIRPNVFFCKSDIDRELQRVAAFKAQ